MTQPPISFSDKASASKTSAGGYPIQISAKDLDANFAYATLEVSDTSPQGDAQPFSVDEITGPSGHTQRRLIFQPAAPTRDALFTVLSGSLIWLQAPDSDLKKSLTSTNYQIEWSNAIQDGTQKGQFLKWDFEQKAWTPFSGSAEGAFPQWDATEGWESQGAGTVNGELLRWNSESSKWEAFGRGTNIGQMIVWGANGWQPAPAPPSSGTHVLGAVDGALTWISTEEC